MMGRVGETGLPFSGKLLFPVIAFIAQWEAATLIHGRSIWLPGQPAVSLHG